MSFIFGSRSAAPSTPATQTQLVREAPGIEERKIELMDWARQVAQNPIAIPAEQVAPLSALEQQGLQRAGQTGVGAPTVAAGIGQILQGAAAPNIQQFLNPFQSYVTDEIARRGQMAQNQLAAQAVGRGAFGGGREGVQQAELQARTLGEIGRARAQGFGTALQAAQNQQRTQLSAGQQLASIGTGQQQMAQRDINQLLQAGGVQRQLAQAALDAQRRTQLQQAYEPFQRVGFLSQTYAAGPKTQSQIEMATAPQTNPLAQSVGSGLAAFQAFSGIQGT